MVLKYQHQPGCNTAWWRVKYLNEGMNATWR